jgi:alpha-galactosidase
LDLGLDKVGYRYVNIDDCWQLPGRDANNHVIVDATKFPNGMKSLGDYLHKLGLKFGIYSSAGTMTCQQRAGSLTYEQTDAADYASWGVDYLKYDNCYNLGLPGPARYNAMRDALNRTGRPIYYSLCSWGTDEVWKWGNNTGNSWRTTNDINDSWKSIVSNYRINDQHPESAGPGQWNDPDMLEIGNGGLTNAEERSHFALWAFAKSPLIIGCDLNKVSSSSLAILRNKWLIGVNQDPLGNQATCVQNCAADIQVIGA